MASKTKDPKRKDFLEVKEIPRKSALLCGKFLLDRLKELGACHIFGIPGDYVLRFDKMIEEHPIQFVNTTRENTAGFMADSYARIKGIGVACITYGVGINITNAVSQAFVESSPLVVISGASGEKEFAHSQRLHHLFNKESTEKRDTTQLEIFKKITVAQTVLDDPQTAASEIERVLNACLSFKKPVYIELPRDKVDAEICPPSPKRDVFPKSDPHAILEVLNEIEEILKNCNKPVIWVGHELQRFGVADAVLSFAEKYHIPIAASLLGKSTISENHPLFLGIYQGKMSQEAVRDYVESSDCIFTFGVILSDVDTGIFTAAFNQPQKIFASTEAISINHHQYNEISFLGLIQALSHLNLNIRFKDNYPALIEKSPKPFKAKKGKITSSGLFECLKNCLLPDNIIVTDFGDSLFGSADIIVEKNAYLSNAYFANIGFCVPAAIGAQIASPEKRVIGIVGDGAFQITCTELSTAVRYKADPIIILLNNHGYATERVLMEGEFNEIGDWKYSELPQVLGGGTGFKVQTEEAFELALKKALSKRGEFALIEVELSKTDYTEGLNRFRTLIHEKNR